MAKPKKVVGVYERPATGHRSRAALIVLVVVVFLILVVILFAQ